MVCDLIYKIWSITGWLVALGLLATNDALCLLAFVFPLLGTLCLTRKCKKEQEVDESR